MAAHVVGRPRPDAGGTRQRAFTIVAAVVPGEVAVLETLLDRIGDDLVTNPFLRFSDFSSLHYASLVLFEDADSTPYLLFEGNLDGLVEPFLDALVETVPTAVDAVFGHCVDYPHIAAFDPHAVVSFLRAHDLGVQTFYVAWRGRTVADIRSEQQLRERIGLLLDEEYELLRKQDPPDIRARIQEVVSEDPDYAWARSTPPRPFLVRHGSSVAEVAVAALAVGFGTLVWGSLRHGSRRRLAISRRLLGAMAVFVAAAVGWLWRCERNDDRRDATRNPDWQGAYAAWSDKLGGVVEHENLQGQNHLASVVKIKSGRFRFALLRVVLWAINLAAEVTANKGSLSGIKSIHFARWVITPDHRHLIFLSNFDGSWERYLTDFIDLASPGLTAIWSNTENDVGFPSTRWLVRNGARDEARFKAFARRSQARTGAWYCAVPDLSNENIENNMIIREQLFAPLDEPTTVEWLRRL